MKNEVLINPSNCDEGSLCEQGRIDVRKVSCQNNLIK